MKNAKGLITLEICLLLIVFVAAGISMFGYFKRAVKGNWRTNVDSFSDEQFDKNRSTTSYDKNGEGPAVVISNTRISVKDTGGGSLSWWAPN
jgi:hypothetical protein